MFPGMFFYALGMAAGLFAHNFSRSLAREGTAFPRCPTTGPLSLRTLPTPAASALRHGARYFPLFFSLSPKSFLSAIITGALFLLSYLNTPDYFGLVKVLGLLFLLLLVSLVDLRSHIIPNTLVLTVLAWGVLWQIILPSLAWHEAFLGMLAGGGFLFLTAVISRGGMGGGDIKLMLAAGFYLGPALTALALFIAVMTGAVAGLSLLILRIKKRKDPMAFGPFLCLGIMSALLFGPLLLELWGLSLHTIVSS